MSAIKVICLDIVFVNQQCRPYQDGERQKCNKYLQRGMQSMRHRLPPSERSKYVSLHVHRRNCGHLHNRAGDRSNFFSLASAFEISAGQSPKSGTKKAKRPPGNRVASSLGRIVPTEAKPSELSGEILSLAK